MLSTSASPTENLPDAAAFTTRGVLALYENAKWVQASALPDEFRFRLVTAFSQCALILRALEAAGPADAEAELTTSLMVATPPLFTASYPDMNSLYEVAIKATARGQDHLATALYDTLDELLPNESLTLRRAAAMLARGDAAAAEKVLQRYRSDVPEHVITKHILLGEARRMRGLISWREEMHKVLALATDAPSRQFAHYALQHY